MSNWVEELRERSKDDHAPIAGSEVRQLCGEIDRLTAERDGADAIRVAVQVQYNDEQAARVAAETEIARLNKAGEDLLQHHINEDARISSERDEALQRGEARFDCHGGPGTTKPSCEACVTCLLRRLEFMEKRAISAEEFNDAELRHANKWWMRAVAAEERAAAAAAVVRAAREVELKIVTNGQPHEHSAWHKALLDALKEYDKHPCIASCGKMVCSPDGIEVGPCIEVGPHRVCMTGRKKT